LCVVFAVKYHVSDIGRDNHLTSRHDAKGVTHEDDRLNTWITVGHITARIAALHSVYGDCCPAALCSLRSGVARILVCDQSSEHDHGSLDKLAHKLPLKSGPLHLKSWEKVQSYKKKTKRKRGDGASSE
jgi:hypothetical protein